MPFPIAAAITGGAGLLSGIFQNSATSRANEEARNFAREMYSVQRADALADRAFENNYNSPAEQMKRLQAAGLNPNLVYGNGSTQSTSISTRQSKADTPSIIPQQFGFILNAAMAAFDALKTQAQTNLLEQQRKTAESLEYLNKANESLTDKRYDLTEEQRKDLVRRNYIGEQTINANIEKPKLANEQTRANIAYTLHQDIRSELLAGQSVKESIQRILNGKSQVELNNAQKARLNVLMQGDKFKNDVLKLESEMSKAGSLRGQNAEQALTSLVLRLVNQIFGSD